jgi:hypothetical protein
MRDKGEEEKGEKREKEREKEKEKEKEKEREGEGEEGEEMGEKEKEKGGKQSGRRKGAVGYIGTDLKGLLDATESVLPISNDEWEQVAQVFNNWATENVRPPRTATGLKDKYCTLVWGCHSGGGERTEFEKRALDIESAINSRAGVMVEGDDISISTPPFSSSSSTSTSSSSQTPK